MTHRTEANQPTPIERATLDTVAAIKENAAAAFHQRGVNSQHGTTMQEFLRILALYFHDKSLTDWCNDFGIADATDPHERRDSQ